MKQFQRIAVLIPMAQIANAHRVRGIAKYVEERKNWKMSINPEAFAMSLDSLHDWHGHGVIALLSNEEQLALARRSPVPVVNMDGIPDPSDVPRVTGDHAATGVMAAEHLLERGFRRFAYYGIYDAWFARERRRTFMQRVAEAGCDCALLEAPVGFDSRQPWPTWLERLETWLKSLRCPVGILAAQDARATMVVEACLRVGLRVPEDVAVIGVDNGEIACEFCDVPLTSIARRVFTEGYEAAALLDRLMGGQPPPKHDILIPPDRLVERRSTDIVAVEDPHVKAAVEYIYEHLSEPFGVESLDRIVPISRRWLERRFSQLLHCTPHEYICRARVQKAKQLLSGSQKLSLQQIAQECGFEESRRLRLVFQRITGMTPARYRIEQRKRTDNI